MSEGALLARRLKLYRRARGLSQEELAGRAGVNRNYVGMIERREHSPTIEVLEKLVSVLGIKVLHLLDTRESIDNAASSPPEEGGT